jgi:ubiquinone/menaquinone biosynthesis C-methylase UbiE
MSAPSKDAPSFFMLTPLERVLEPEVMDTEEEARAYDAMDHIAVNNAFCSDLLALKPDLLSTLDVGAGTALIPIELCRRSPNARVVAIDLAASMLELAASNVARAGLNDLIQLKRIDAKSLPFDDGSFSCVISNSILHHIPDPRAVLAEMLRVIRPGGLMFVRDLIRPATDADVIALVQLHAAGADDQQRSLLNASLRAAFTLDEVRTLAAGLGIPSSCVQMTSDRHWTLAYKRPLEER